MIDCPTCGGTGKLPDPDERKDCEAIILVRHETITCYASRPHPGEPHYALLETPACPTCGGYDEHARGCTTDVSPEGTRWFRWSDSVTFITEDDAGGEVWTRKYGPNAP